MIYIINIIGLLIMIYDYSDYKIFFVCFDYIFFKKKGIKMYFKKLIFIFILVILMVIFIGLFKFLSFNCFFFLLVMMIFIVEDVVVLVLFMYL